MSANIELYEAFKDKVGAEAATLLANSIPMAENLADKDDIRNITSAIHSLELNLELKIEAVRGEIKDTKSELMRWMLAFFVPLWLGVYGTLAAVVVTVLIKT